MVLILIVGQKLISLFKNYNLKDLIFFVILKKLIILFKKIIVHVIKL